MQDNLLNKNKKGLLIILFQLLQQHASLYLIDTHLDFFITTIIVPKLITKNKTKLFFIALLLSLIFYSLGGLNNTKLILIPPSGKKAGEKGKKKKRGKKIINKSRKRPPVWTKRGKNIPLSEDKNQTGGCGKLLRCYLGSSVLVL